MSSDYEAIVGDFLKRAEKIKSMCAGKPPNSCAQLLAVAGEYEKHAERIRSLASVAPSKSGPINGGRQNA